MINSGLFFDPIKHNISVTIRASFALAPFNGTSQHALLEVFAISLRLANGTPRSFSTRFSRYLDASIALALCVRLLLLAVVEIDLWRTFAADCAHCHLRTMTDRFATSILNTIIALASVHGLLVLILVERGFWRTLATQRTAS